MPIVVDPLSPQPAVVADVVSGDGVLTARVDTAHAGVLLVVAGAGSDLVRVSRVNPDGSQVLVRSGDPCYAPGGGGVVYDHEAPLGRAVEYRAAPLFPDGSTGQVSVVSVQVPEPRSLGNEPRDSWLKSLDEPDLSLRAWVTQRPEVTYAGRMQTVSVPGRPAPLATWDVHAAMTTTMTIATTSDEEVRQLRAIADAGVALYQTRQEYGYEDMFVLIGDLSGTQPAPLGPRLWQLPLTAVDRPDTFDAPARIPGRSLGALNVPGATLGGLSGGTYLDLVAG